MKHTITDHAYIAFYSRITINSSSTIMLKYFHLTDSIPFPLTLLHLFLEIVTDIFILFLIYV